MALLDSVCRAAVEGFTNGSQDPSKKREIYTEVIAALLAFFLALVILGFIGKLLWNNVIVELFTVVKPARSFWQILGLMVFVALVRP